MASLGRRIERMLPRNQRARRINLPAGEALEPAIAAMVRALPEPRLLRLVYERIGIALGLAAPAPAGEPEPERAAGLIEGIEVDLDRWVRARSRAELIQIVTPWIRAHVLGQTSAAEPAPEVESFALPTPGEPSAALQALLAEAIMNGGFVRLAHAPMCPVAPGVKARAGGEIVDNAAPCDCWVARARALLGLSPLDHIPAPGPTALELRMLQEREEARERLWSMWAARWKQCAKTRVPKARHLDVLAELQGARGAVAELGEELQAASEVLDEASAELVAARAGATVALAAAVHRAEVAEAGRHEAEAAIGAARIEGIALGAGELRAARLDAEEVRRERGELLRALDQHRSEVRSLISARERDASEATAQAARAETAEARVDAAGLAGARAQEEAILLRAQVALLEGQLVAARRERSKARPLKRTEAEWVEEVREMLANELRSILPGEADRVEHSLVRSIKGLAEIVRAHADPRELSNGLRKILGLTEEDLEAAAPAPAPTPPTQAAARKTPAAPRPPRARRPRRPEAQPALIPPATPAFEDEMLELEGDDVPEIEEPESDKPVAAATPSGVVLDPDEVRRRLNARLLEQRERQRMKSGFYIETVRAESTDGDEEEDAEPDDEDDEG